MAEFSWTKLADDEWGVRAWDAPGIGQGDTVQVRSKAGKVKTAKLGRLMDVRNGGRARVYEVERQLSIGDEDNSKPRPPKVELPGPDEVPAGRYAYPLEPVSKPSPANPYVKYEDEVWVFVKVWRGSRNPNVVRCYLIEALDGDDRGAQVEAKDTLERILSLGVGRAAQEFGWRTGRCGRCNDKLLVNLYRRLGIGEHCMKHVYGDQQRASLKAAARHELRKTGIDPAAKHDSLEAVIA